MGWDDLFIENMKWPIVQMGFPGGSVVKNTPASVGDTGLVLESGRSPEGGIGNPLQYSCLENPMNRGAWWATFHGVARVGHDLETKQQSPDTIFLFAIYLQSSILLFYLVGINSVVEMRI